MSVDDKYNAIALIEESLTFKIKSTLSDRIMDRLLSDFKEKAEKIVKEEVYKTTLEGIETFRDMSRMRDEIVVYCKWEEDDEGYDR